jgi:biopolymer transport protein ExbD
VSTWGEPSAGSDDLEGSESVVAEINITPLTDVFLVLLIIFMVTTIQVVDAEKQAARRGEGRPCPRRRARASDRPRGRCPILTITKADELYLFTRRIEPKNLEEELRKALKDGNSDTLLLRGDKQVISGTAVDVMSVAKRAGRQEHRHPDAARASSRLAVRARV